MRLRTHWAFLVAALAGLAAGCSDGKTDEDAGVDSGVVDADASGDAGMDASDPGDQGSDLGDQGSDPGDQGSDPGDQGSDAGSDPGSDSGDQGADPGGDSGPGDGDHDAGLDAGPDGDQAGDGDQQVTWECPSQADYIGDDWPGMLSATDELCMLGDGYESMALEQALADRALIRFAPGEYPLPTAAGNYTGRLPVCVQIADIGPPLVLGGAGDLSVAVYSDWSSVGYTQIMYDQQGQEWTLRIYLGGVSGELLLESASLYSQERRLRLIPSETPPQRYDYRRHRVTFTRGFLDSEFIAMWGGTPSSGILFGASGELDGVAFEQDDYWNLTNNFYHHFFGADWAVLFDSPIGTACGIMVTNGEPVGLNWEWPDPTVSTIQCDFTVDQELGFLSTDVAELEPFRLPCPDLHP